MKKKIYIDADSILYRASHLACGDKALEEAQAIAITTHGEYLIGVEKGSSQGEEGEIEIVNTQYIIADTEQEAKAIYAKNNNFSNTGYLKSKQFIPLEEDVELETAESNSQLDDMIRIFHSMTNDIVRAVQEDAGAKGYEVDPEPIHVITVKGKHEVCKDLADNFRYAEMASVEDPNVKGYKANRAGMEVPDGLNDIYEYAFNLETSICESGVEADDVVVYYGRQGHIVCALDKDVLGSLEYAYNYGRQEWVENDPREIAMFPYFQTITGDTSDGLRGVFRVGAKGAEKALAGTSCEYSMWAVVVKTYAMKDQTMEEAIATMRCVRMDQWTPENGLVLWSPPKKDRETEPTFNKDPNAPQWRYVDTKEEIPND
jgi:hypothetical protein